MYEEYKSLIEPVDKAISLLEKFPSDFSPGSSKPKSIEEIMSEWPSDLVDMYITCGNVIGIMLHKLTEVFLKKELDDTLIHARELRRTMHLEIFSMFPLSETVGALLGSNALRVIAEGSSDEPSFLWPYEVDRIGWFNLMQIREQIVIDRELSILGGLYPFDSKLFVMHAWAMVAMSTFIDPRIFINERQPKHTWSGRGFTLSQGEGIYNIVNYVPGSMILVLKVLREALLSEDIDACDMMWIAAALAEIKSIRMGYQELVLVNESGPHIFLSHRGLDSKKDLMYAVFEIEEQKRGHNYFLDCLNLPRKQVNGRFIFENLVRSDAVLIVESENYWGSPWCRKEAWLAEVLARHGKVEKINVSSVESAAKLMSARSSERIKSHSPRRVALGFDGTSWVCARVLKDINNQHFQPNLHSASSKGMPVDCFEPILEFLSVACGSPTMQFTAGNMVNRMYEELLNSLEVSKVGEEEVKWRRLFLMHYDLWCTAAQLTIGAMSISLDVYSKMETRRYLSVVRGLVRKIIELLANEYDDGLDEVEDLVDNVIKFLKCACVAIVLELAGESYYLLSENQAICQANCGAYFYNGQLLFDVRDDGPSRLLMLRFVLLLVRHDIGSVGIIQSGEDTVHNLVLDGMDLSVLPCVTVYPGMEDLIERMKSQARLD